MDGMHITQYDHAGLDLPSLVCHLKLTELEQKRFERVSMGLTDRRKTAMYLVDSRKNWKILTVSRK